MDNDARYMAEALGLARRGLGFVSPNPMVGCVIVRDGAVVGRGWHARPGEAHAEVIALREAGERARGATMYVTLEPCCHSGGGKRTPPCVPAVIAAGVRRVVVAMHDPNPRVDGGGERALREAGVEVTVGALSTEAAELNRGYVSLMRRGRPFVTAKWAMSLDGRIAAKTGDSKWISSEASRQLVHGERAATDAVVVGIGTVKADNPRLTARPDGVEAERQPLRVVVDPRLELPVASELVASARKWPILVFAGPDAGDSGDLEARGVQVVRQPLDGHGHLAWDAMLRVLAERGCANVLLEGGGGLLGSAFDQGAVDRVLVFVAPLILGGESAVSPVLGDGQSTVSAAVRLEGVQTKTIGSDTLIEARVARAMPAPIAPGVRE